jgi:hypothetical protein
MKKTINVQLSVFQKFKLLMSVFFVLTLTCIVISCKKQDTVNSDTLDIKQIKRGSSSLSDFMLSYNKGILNHSYRGSAKNFALSMIESKLSEFKRNDDVFSRTLEKINIKGKAKLQLRAKGSFKKVAFDDQQPPDLSEAFEAMDELLNATHEYISITAYGHLENLISKIEADATTYESIHTNAQLTQTEMSDFKAIINNSITLEETNISNNFSMDSQEKNTLLSNLSLMKNTLSSENFDNSVYNFVDNGGDSVVSLIAFNSFFAKGFFRNLARAVLYGVVVVVSGIAGAVIGSAIGGFAGSVIGAAAGTLYALEWAHEWLWPDAVEENVEPGEPIPGEPAPGIDG